MYRLTLAYRDILTGQSGKLFLTVYSITLFILYIELDQNLEFGLFGNIELDKNIEFGHTPFFKVLLKVAPRLTDMALVLYLTKA